MCVLSLCGAVVILKASIWITSGAVSGLSVQRLYPAGVFFMQAFLVSTGIVALAEMGDKTQIATVMLAARYDAMVSVVAGTTLGMMLANVPVVFLGERVTRLVPLRVVHVVSALFFALLGMLALFIRT